MIAGENIPGAAHIRRKLVDFIELPVDHRPDIGRLSQIRDDEIVGFGPGVTRMLQVNTPHPASLGFKAMHQMAADKAARPEHENLFHTEISTFIDSKRTAESHAEKHPSYGFYGVKV